MVWMNEKGLSLGVALERRFILADISSVNMHHCKSFMGQEIPLSMNDSFESVHSLRSPRCRCGFAASPGLLALAAVFNPLSNAICGTFHAVRQGLQTIASCFGAGGVVDGASDSTSSCSDYAAYGAGYAADCGAELCVL